MNKLFKDGDYILLSDCEAFDKKYGLEKNTTKWAVARKMEGGEPKSTFMMAISSDVVVGISSEDDSYDVGLWGLNEYMHTQLTVEDVLYRSEDGLTLDELSKIHGAFEKGKAYECVKPAGTFSLGQVSTYKGSGLRTRHGAVATSGSTAKFKPVTPKKQWVPSVGEEVYMDLACKKVRVEVILKHEVCVSDGKELLIRNIRDFKPIDEKRESTIKKCNSIWRDKNNGVSGSEALQLIETLYDAGMLKEGDK